ncbi:MAG: Na-translocating system protein MpsC family protein [Planctomycetia bacterium]
MAMTATFTARRHAPYAAFWPAPPVDQRLARQVALATGSFEHLLLGRAPTSVSVVAHDEWMVVNVHESLSPLERRLARDEAGRTRVQEYHRELFESTLDALRDHVRQATGVTLQSGMAHVEPATGSLLKTLSTHATIELFLLGDGLPGLGVPVNVHLYAHGSDGIGPVHH